MDLVALMMALFVVAVQPAQVHAKQRIAAAHMGDPGDGLDGDPTDGEGGDPGDGDEGDPTDANGRGASVGDPGDGDGVTVVLDSRKPGDCIVGVGALAHFGWPLATTPVVALLIARIRCH